MTNITTHVVAGPVLREFTVSGKQTYKAASKYQMKSPDGQGCRSSEEEEGLYE